MSSDAAQPPLAALPPSSTSRLNFGKHADKTYADVIQSHPDYCRWILNNCGPDKGNALRIFAAYLRANFQSAAPPDSPPKSVASHPVTPPTKKKAPRAASLSACAVGGSRIAHDGMQMCSWQPALDTLLSSIIYAVLDTETTGVSKRDRVVEVAVQRIASDGRPLLPMFSSLINPGSAISMSPKATEVTGITDAMIRAADVPTFANIYPVLKQQLEGCVIVAHNASFDQRLIVQSCEGQLLPPIQPWLCSWRDLSKRLLPSLASHKLVDICGYYGISISAHRARGDVEALAKALPRLFADAERLHGIRTWGDLQQFIGQ
jgi:DNA polymerase-3 subunit epsilon